MEKAKQMEVQQSSRVLLGQLVTLQDLDDFKHDLLVSIKAIVLNNNQQAGKKWLKSYEVKRFLNISTGTLQNLRSNGTLPHTKIGGLIYYDAELINKVMSGQGGETKQSARPILKKR